MTTPYRESLAALESKKAALEATLEHLHARSAEGSRALTSARLVERELLAALAHVEQHGPLQPMEPPQPRWNAAQLAVLGVLGIVALAAVGLILAASAL